MDSVLIPGLMAGKAAMVVGGTSGINLGIARSLARSGAHVAVLGRKADKAEAAARELQALQPDARWYTADVRDYNALSEAITKAAQDLGQGGLDILVAGAAGNFPAPAVAMSANAFKSVVDIDLLGAFNTFRAGFEHLKKPGAVALAVSAPQATSPTPFQAHVCAAKAGINMLIRTLSLEWGPAGVRVLGLSPGPIEGTEGMERLAPPGEARKNATLAVPLQRFGTIEEMGEVALWLCSPGARYLHGTIVAADGGLESSGFGRMIGA